MHVHVLLQAGVTDHDPLLPQYTCVELITKANISLHWVALPGCYTITEEDASIGLSYDDLATYEIAEQAAETKMSRFVACMNVYT